MISKCPNSLHNLSFYAEFEEFTSLATAVVMHTLFQQHIWSIYCISYLWKAPLSVLHTKLLECQPSKKTQNQATTCRYDENRNIWYGYGCGWICQRFTSTKTQPASSSRDPNWSPKWRSRFHPWKNHQKEYSEFGSGIGGVSLDSHHNSKPIPRPHNSLLRWKWRVCWQICWLNLPNLPKFVMIFLGYLGEDEQNLQNVYFTWNILKL